MLYASALHSRVAKTRTRSSERQQRLQLQKTIEQRYSPDSHSPSPGQEQHHHHHHRRQRKYGLARKRSMSQSDVNNALIKAHARRRNNTQDSDEESPSSPPADYLVRKRHSASSTVDAAPMRKVSEDNGEDLRRMVAERTLDRKRSETTAGEEDGTIVDIIVTEGTAGEPDTATCILPHSSRHSPSGSSQQRVRCEVRRSRTQELARREKSSETPRATRKISAMASVGEDGRRNAMVMVRTASAARDDECLVEDYIPQVPTRKVSSNPLSKLFNRMKT